MLILASSSKARKNLLDQAEIDYKVIISDISEEDFSANSAQELAHILSVEKAKSVVKKIYSSGYDNSINQSYTGVLGCDSLFEFKGEIFGKPKNSQEAFDRWIKMSGSAGILHTGHCLKFRKLLASNIRSEEFNTDENIVISTKVCFCKLTEREIERYVLSKEAIQCAGGFALDGKGAKFIESIQGCFSNVIGLSLPWLRTALFKAEISY